MIGARNIRARPEDRGDSEGDEGLRAVSTLFEAAMLDRLLASLTEARKKIGIRMAKNIRKISVPRKGRATKMKATRRTHRPWRTGAVYNRHRAR